MLVLCFGSLAFDRLMSYNDVFAKHIIPEKIDKMSLSFLVENLTRNYGGTAGNIAYNLTLLGEKPLVIGSLGKDTDGDDYLNYLNNLGADTRFIKQHANVHTAEATVVSDNINNQFTFFNFGAMNCPSNFNLESLKEMKNKDYLAIVSPGGSKEMLSLCETFRREKIKFIFDPGQQLPDFSKDELLSMLDDSFIFIANEYEVDLFLKKTSLKLEDLFRYTEIVIKTKGAKGSELITPRVTQHIKAVRPLREVLNPTGAGDAFRAGLIKALISGEKIITACRLGSAVASFCVEAQAMQDYTFTMPELLARYQMTFHEAPSLR